MIATDFVCAECSTAAGEWFDCQEHKDCECFVLRCNECDYASYDHDEQEEEN
jgi:hypothetical protein